MVKQCVDSESRLVALRRPIQSQKEVVAELYDQRLIHRRGLGASLPDKPLSDTYDIFLVDLGCFTSLINQGRLRLILDGQRRLLWSVSPWWLRLCRTSMRATWSGNTVSPAGRATDPVAVAAAR